MPVMSPYHFAPSGVFAFYITTGTSNATRCANPSPCATNFAIEDRNHRVSAFTSTSGTASATASRVSTPSSLGTPVTSSLLNPCLRQRHVGLLVVGAVAACLALLRALALHAAPPRVRRRRGAGTGARGCARRGLTRARGWRWRGREGGRDRDRDRDRDRWHLRRSLVLYPRFLAAYCMVVEKGGPMHVCVFG
eukprot:6202923-Pleurochrysis_carterae.AAC.3